jgi:phosphate transport system permease protein
MSRSYNKVELQPTDWKTPAAVNLIRKRYRAERNFKRVGLFALILAGSFLAFLLFTIIGKGIPGFFDTQIKVAVQYDPELLGVTPEQAMTKVGKGLLSEADYSAILKSSLAKRFPNAEGRTARRELTNLISISAETTLRDRLLANPSLIGKSEVVSLMASDDTDLFAQGAIDLSAKQEDRIISDQSISFLKDFESKGDLSRHFNWRFFTAADSREPELAGIGGALKGTFLTLLITLVLSFPIAVAAALYLEEFAPKNRLTDFIEVNINNLAAVPSIIFGLLGLAVFLGTFGMPRSAPLVGGLTLALMTLPTIVIASRIAIKAVPPSIRDAATGLGASPLQVVFHHVFPLAIPGILTGTIIGMARALGETAPLLMIGMAAFIVEMPQRLTDSATVLPMQIYIWSDSAERLYVAKTSAAIMVLLGFLILMNAVAIYLRNKFERKW